MIEQIDKYNKVYANRVTRWPDAPYNQVRAHGVVEPAKLRQELYYLGAPPPQIEAAATISYTLEGEIRDIFKRGGVVSPTFFRLGKSEDLTFRYCALEKFLDSLRIAGRPSIMRAIKRGIARLEDVEQALNTRDPQAIFIRYGLEQDLGYSSRRDKYYIDLEDYLTSRRPNKLDPLVQVLIQRTQLKYQAAQIPPLISPITLVRQTLYSISRTHGLGNLDNPKSLAHSSSKPEESGETSSEGKLLVFPPKIQSILDF